MLGRLLFSGELTPFSSFISPAFFDVVPAKPLWQRAKELVSFSRSCAEYRRAVAERSSLLERSHLPIRLNPTPGTRERDPSGEHADRDTRLALQQRGAHLTALYFHQLWHGDVTLIDLRRRAFGPGANPRRADLDWQPTSWMVRWERSFIESMRHVYAGFYAERWRDFRAGLASLNLHPAEDVLRAHFGTTRVKFEVKHFVSTFKKVFVRCRDARTSLHPDFLALGLYLATLYDHLEDLDVTVDVAASFELATRTALEPQFGSQLDGVAHG